MFIPQWQHNARKMAALSDAPRIAAGTAPKASEAIRHALVTDRNTSTNSGVSALIDNSISAGLDASTLAEERNMHQRLRADGGM